MASDRRFKVLIPAAGESLRFVAEGYRTPKPDLKISVDKNGHHKSMLDYVLGRLPENLFAYENVVIGVRPGMTARSASTVTIEKTRGQADTLLQMAVKSCNPNDTVLVLNSDVLFRPTDINHIFWRVVGKDAPDICVGVQATKNPAMSFVNQFPDPTGFAEKDAISGWAMSGVWAFKNASDLILGLARAMEGNEEPYLSQAMNYMTGTFEAVALAEKNIVDWGTPQAVLRSGAEIVNGKD